jgi:dCMP deaminase
MLSRALDISVSVKLGSDDAGRLEIVGLDKDDNEVFTAWTSDGGDIREMIRAGKPCGVAVSLENGFDPGQSKEFTIMFLGEAAGRSKDIGLLDMFSLVRAASKLSETIEMSVDVVDGRVFVAAKGDRACVNGFQELFSVHAREGDKFRISALGESVHLARGTLGFMMVFDDEGLTKDFRSLVSDLGSEYARAKMNSMSEASARAAAKKTVAMAASLERSPWVDPRPSWDEYFLGICEAVSKRSIDSETKHGAVFVDQRHNIVATGYNGPLAGIDDSKVPVTRPAKYPHMAHAEANCVAQAASRGVAVLGSVAYVTGMPCPACMQLMLQSGVARVVCGPRSSACVDEGQRKLSLEKAGAKGVPVEFFGVER